MRYFWLCLLIFAFSCKKDDAEIIPVTENSLISLTQVPEGFPEPEYPEDNLFSIQRWKLGKKLFYDPIMSFDGSISCATCHKSQLAFSDDVALSNGAAGAAGLRNASSLTNIVYHPHFTREGGVPTLEMHVLVPIQEHNEFNSNIIEIAERLSNISEYVEMAERAYGRAPDPFVIGRAIACFERTLLSGNSAYDREVLQNIPGNMNASSLRGMELFFSDRTQCSSCHSGFNFSNYEFENNGLYDVYADPGRYRLTNDMVDLAKFKIPSLRNVSLTAPYMHDGSLANLEEVITHYVSGGSAHQNKSPLIHSLDLNDAEKQDLIAFLESLTDYEFVNNPNFKP